MTHTKTPHALTVLVDSIESRETVRKVLDQLINVGLADAQATLEAEEGGDRDSAQIAVDADFHSPQ